MAAHPAFHSDGSVWNMTSQFGPKAKNTFISFKDDIKPIKHASFDTDKTYYFHSFGNTSKYMVSIEQPMYLSFSRFILSSFSNLSYYQCHDWNKDAYNIFHILNRETGTVQKIPTQESFFFFHTINTFQDGDTLSIDLCGYRDNKVIDDFYMDVMRTRGISEENKASLIRLKVNIVSGEVTLEDKRIHIELPSINTKFAGREHRYSYGIHGSQGCKYLSDCIIKYDHKN